MKQIKIVKIMQINYTNNKNKHMSEFITKCKEFINRTKLTIQNFINKIGKDKLYHFIIALLTTLIFGNIFNNVVALGVALVVSILKEIYDEYSKGTGWNWKDLFADILGIIIGLLIL